jgi:hypothetical protein
MLSIVAKSDTGPLCIYIAARGHSGSTMFELLLNRYTEIAAVGEIDQLPLQIVRDGVDTKWVGLCSCESRPSDCEIWRAVFDRVSSDRDIDLSENPFALPVSDIGLSQEFGWGRPVEQVKFAMHRAVRGMSHRLGLRLPPVFPYRAWVRNRDLIYRVIAKKRGVSAIVDASKDAFQMSDLLRYSELSVKVLFLTRDVRGNVWSSVRRNDASAADEARNWASVNGQIYSRLKAMPQSSWMHVKYEDICSNTDVTMDRIMRFLGIDCRAVSPAEEQARRHTIAGNKVRFAPLNAIRHDQSWRENLSSQQIEEIRRIAGPLARTLNYRI